MRHIAEGLSRVGSTGIFRENLHERDLGSVSAAGLRRIWPRHAEVDSRSRRAYPFSLTIDWTIYELGALTTA